MNYKSLLLMAVTTLSLLMMGPVYATSPQKSTIILINGDDVNKPVECAGDFPCLLREAGVDFIYRRGSESVTVFYQKDVDTVCDVGRKAGKALTVFLLNDSHTCS